MVLGIGLLLVAAGVVLLFDLGGAAGFVIRRLTSRSLGELAPGYAANRGGFRVYAALVLSVGVLSAGLGISPGAALPGAILITLGIAAFVAGSVAAIVGEVRTFRALPGKRRSDER